MLARALGRVVSVGPLKALFIPVTPLIFRAQVETLRSARSTGALLHAGRTCPKEPNMVSCACWQGCTDAGGVLSCAAAGPNHRRQQAAVPFFRTKTQFIKAAHGRRLGTGLNLCAFRQQRARAAGHAALQKAPWPQRNNTQQQPCPKACDQW